MKRLCGDHFWEKQSQLGQNAYNEGASGLRSLVAHVISKLSPRTFLTTVVSGMFLLSGCSEAPKSEIIKLDPLSHEFDYSTDLTRLQQAKNALHAKPEQLEKLREEERRIVSKVGRLHNHRKWKEALDLLGELLEKQKKLLGKDSIYLVKTYDRMRKDLQKLGDFTYAQFCADEASRLADYYFGMESPDATKFRIHAINVIEESGDRATAIRKLQEFLVRLKQHDAGVSSEAAVRFQLARCLEKESKYDDAVKQLQICADLKRNSLTSYSVEPRHGELINRILEVKGKAARFAQNAHPGGSD